MNVEIPKTFPHNMTDAEIQRVISDCAKRATNVTKPNQNIILGASYYISMIELGQLELNKRIQSGLLDLITKQNEINKKSSRINRILTIVTIALAILTLYIGKQSLGFAEFDQKSDEIWQSQQIELLEKQNKELRQLSEYLIRITEKDSIKTTQKSTLKR